MKVKKLKEENFNLKDRIASLETEVKANQNYLEINKLSNERDRLILEIDEWQAKYNRLQRELKGQKEENEELRDQLRKAKGIADELEDKNNFYNQKMKSLEKQVYENNKKDAKLLNIEDMINKINKTLIVHKEEENTKDNKEIQNYRKMLKKLGCLLKRLARGLMKNLENKHVQDLFRFGNIALDNKDKLYKSLLKIIAALHYVNKNSKLVKDTFDKWKSLAEPKEKPKTINKEPVVQHIGGKGIMELASRSINDDRPILNKEEENKLDKSLDNYELDMKPYELSNDELLREYKTELEVLKKELNEDSFRDMGPILYYRIINGITKYFFNIYLIILKDAKLKQK